MSDGTTYVRRDEAELLDLAERAIAQARALGATAASARASASGGVRFVARDGMVETRLRDGHQSIGITVYRDRRSGSASTTALDPGSIARAVEQAHAIAGHAQPDPDGGLADPDWLASDPVRVPLSDPATPAAETVMAEALAIDAAVRDLRAGHPVRIAEAGAATYRDAQALALSTGFRGTGTASFHSRWASVLAGADGDVVRDQAQSHDRRIGGLTPAALLAGQAVGRAVAAVGARTMPGGPVRVLFEPRVASAIVMDVVSALSGGPQERGTSFLRGTLGRDVAAAHVDLDEDPFEPFGTASGGFDGEGVAGSARAIVEAGVVAGYFLGSRSARRLGMRSTGNADGPWNLRLTSRAPGGDRDAMLARLGDGVFVTQLMGGATDPVSGNWTRAVLGFRVAGGRIVHPVTDVTLGGTMDAMLRGIEAVGDDVERHGGLRSGSILIDRMMLGGAA